jgi:hypothetical protein
VTRAGTLRSTGLQSLNGPRQVGRDHADHEDSGKEGDNPERNVEESVAPDDCPNATSDESKRNDDRNHGEGPRRTQQRGTGMPQPTHHFGRLVLRVEMMHFESLTWLLRMHARRQNRVSERASSAAM